ncbi:MAG: 30S ribosomal protein S9 [Patescibacteria group bacterium]
MESATKTNVFEGKYTESVGRRKRAIARVRMFPGQGKGKVLVNDKELAVYFPLLKLQEKVMAPLNTTGRKESFNIQVKVVGGGITGQAEAVRLGISRGLVMEDADLKSSLKKEGFMTRDSRRRERKKPGKRSARRSPQWSKR